MLNKIKTSRTGNIMKNTLFHAAALASFAMISGQAAAQSDEGLVLTGQTELEYLHSNSSSDTLLATDMLLSYRGGYVGGVGLGFELGVDADLLLDSGDSYSALYGAVLLSTMAGEFAIGAPKPITDLLIEKPSFAGMKALDLELAALSPSIVGSASKLGDAQSYGLRYSGASGALRYGASVHKLHGVSGTLYQAAAEYSFGSSAVEGAIESDSLTGNYSGTIGVTHSAGQFDIGAYVTRERQTLDGNMFQLSADYRVSDSLKVGGDVARLNFGSRQTLFGLSAEYGFGNGAYVQGGVADGDGMRTTMDASVGFKF
jgi:hypothetical protein